MLTTRGINHESNDYRTIRSLVNAYPEHDTVTAVRRHVDLVAHLEAQLAGAAQVLVQTESAGGSDLHVEGQS